MAHDTEFGWLYKGARVVSSRDICFASSRPVHQRLCLLLYRNARFQMHAEFKVVIENATPGKHTKARGWLKSSSIKKYDCGQRTIVPTDSCECDLSLSLVAEEIRSKTLRIKACLQREVVTNQRHRRPTFHVSLKPRFDHPPPLRAYLQNDSTHLAAYCSRPCLVKYIPTCSRDQHP